MSVGQCWPTPQPEHHDASLSFRGIAEGWVRPSDVVSEVGEK